MLLVRPPLGPATATYLPLALEMFRPIAIHGVRGAAMRRPVTDTGVMSMVATADNTLVLDRSR